MLRKETGILKDYRATVPMGHRYEADALVFLNAVTSTITAQIERVLQPSVKFILILTAEMEKLAGGPQHDAEPNTILTKVYFRSTSMSVLNRGEIGQALEQAKGKIMESLEIYTNEGSGWRLKRCEALDLDFAEYQPFRGQSYIKTPAYIPPRTVINVRNEDNRCLEWALLSATYLVDSKRHASSPSKLEAHLGELDLVGIDFPVKVTDVAKFE